MTPAEAAARVEAMLLAGNGDTPIKVDVFLGEPTPRTDDDGKAHPYAAIFPGAGVRDLSDATVSGESGARAWRFQVTCAGGDVPRCLRAITRTQNVLVDQRLDDTTGLIREDGDGGQIRPDTTVKPTRWFLPLLFAVDL